MFSSIFQKRRRPINLRIFATCESRNRIAFSNIEIAIRCRSSAVLRRISMAETEPKLKDSASEEKKGAKSPNILERAKEEIEAVFHHDKSHHHYKETHGRSDDIDEKTPSDEVKGPNVFERVKEEIEAVVDAIHPKKESSSHGSSPQ